MSVNVQQGSGPLPDDDDSDTISVNSEGDEEYDSGTEFVVEDVHCEQIDLNDGRLKYLVEWANFPLDECTWEPEEELPQELRDQWETKKATQDPSVAAAFEKKYNEAFNEKLEERRQLHRRRNAKRRRLGLPETKFYFRNHYYPDSEDDVDVEVVEEPNSEVRSESDASSDTDSEEAQEDNAFDDGAKDSVLPLKSSSQKPVRHPNKIFKTDPNIASKPQSKTSTSGKDKEQSRQQPQKANSTGSSTILPKTQSTSTLPERQRKLSSTTGYQGSARRPSNTQPKPAPRKADVSTSRPGSSSKGATALASNLTKKSITAKKSGQAPISTVNIFTGGKKRQARQHLGSTMVDASKGPKFFTKARIRRKAELRSRDNDDRPPDPTQVMLFNISEPPPPRKTSRQHDDSDSLFVSNADDLNMQTDTISSAGLRRSSTTASEPKSAMSKRSSLCLDSDRPKKKAKSVRFTGEDDQPFVSEPMEIDELPGPSTRMRSPPPPPGSPSPPAPPAPAPRARLSLADYHTRSVQSVRKKIVLAPGNQCLDATFNGIPKDASREPDQRWLPKFLDAGCLRVGHTVLAESLVSQLNSVRRQDHLGRTLEILCSGTITLGGEDNKLDVIAEHLRVGHSGLLVTLEDYNLVIYPTKCAGFQTDLLGMEPLSPDGVALKYFAFWSPHDISRLIRPISVITEESTDMAVGQDQKAIFRELFGLHYHQLVAGPCGDKDHHFYLIFPEEAIIWYRSLCCWLFACKPECKIYTSFDPGSWSAFLEKASNQCGVVILHEAVASSVRRFPCVAESLQSHNIQYWRFSESVEMFPIRPCVSGVDRSTPAPLSRVFPWGKAILLTPSFIVSQPQKTYEFLRWYFPNQAKHSMKLVTAYNIVDYLRDLTQEKCELQETLKKTKWRAMNSLDVALEKKLAGLTDEDLVARGSAWAHAEDWLSVSMERNGIFSEENHVVFADRSIDANDEQSLVNWFGWWSLARAEEYRKFFVIGSSSLNKDTKRNSPNVPSRARRAVLIPNYERSVVNDPNEASRTAMRNVGELADEGAVPTVPKAWFPSERFANSEDRIKDFLSLVDRPPGYAPPGHARVFNRPVSWVDMTMADHFGDTKTKFSTIQQWFRWPFPWLEDYQCSFNTYIAYFYTMREDWDPAKFPQGIKPRRHPWLAVYRPVEPHNRIGKYRHGRTELIIWDVRAGDELEDNKSIGLEDLTWMQRELIRYIQVHGAEKDPGSRLERVWLGGFQVHQAECSSTLPADKTAECVEALLENLKWKLPSTDGYMQRNGWRPVSFLEPLGSKLRLRNRKSFGQGGASDNYTNDKDTRIIFHPPRGSGEIGPRGSSKCTNDLYEAARLARLHKSSAMEMEYTFRPTMEWYSELVAEGRQYEHIFVDEWEKVFAQLGVNKGQRSKQNRMSISSEQNGQSRKDSVASSHSNSMDVGPF
ncbi:hypothetical protein VM1G_03272 [Cytospora mali]|uniref:Chromo domain-containing protein n=1 Tax=Cytospora mali TaxID=578113 RepID=A0A194VV00_CYTMA|nr:hypothetical protein VM1G_03272 [Valsa mali]